MTAHFRSAAALLPFGGFLLESIIPIIRMLLLE